jgi:hypothetical protein
MAQMGVEQLDRHALKGTGGGRDLCQDVYAVHVLVDHPLQSTDLAFDAPQPLLDVVLCT